MKGSDLTCTCTYVQSVVCSHNVCYKLTMCFRPMTDFIAIQPALSSTCTTMPIEKATSTAISNRSEVSNAPSFITPSHAAHLFSCMICVCRSCIFWLDRSERVASHCVKITVIFDSLMTVLYRGCSSQRSTSPVIITPTSPLPVQPSNH